jgi:hypothetical protein
MKIELSKPFLPNGAVDEYDVRQMKKALNRLGYYTPYEKIGITDIPDSAVFEALKNFQRDHGLNTTGTAKPTDKTIAKLNEKIKQEPEGYYIWRTAEDSKVRAAHAQYNRTVRAWSDAPDPGEDFNCRCWAEPISKAKGLIQTVISPVQYRAMWSWVDFVQHYYNGGGRVVIAFCFL